jgi:hypothetical protein
VVAISVAHRFSTAVVAVGTLVFFVAYLLVALGIFGKTLIWLPAILPAGTLLLIILLRSLAMRPAPRNSVHLA